MSTVGAQWHGNEGSEPDARMGDFHGDDEASCAKALTNVQAFLHGELDESLADDIRHHLLACEKCLDDFHVEELITALVQRCHRYPENCSETLKARVNALHVTLV